MRVKTFAVVATVSLVGVTSARVDPRTTSARPAPRTLPGWSLYDRYCLACHGALGDGRGPAATLTSVRPRAFTAGAFAWRTTPVGQPPTDDDLRAAIRYGAPGTSMPGFDHVLDAAQIDRLIEVVKAFAPPPANAPAPIALAPPGAPDPERGGALWRQHGCATCHGASGRPDPAAAARGPAPYDLTAEPLRRPRPSDDPDARRRAAAASIATGLAGTRMPGYAGTMPDADLWALADHVVAIGARGSRAARGDRSALTTAAIAADRANPIALGTWPGVDPDDDRVFGSAIPPQGPAPSALAPAQASLSARQCARCHAKQAREWSGSVHAAAAVWGLPARELDHADAGGSCARCHAPLAEQQTGAASAAELRDEGVTCAGCHVRGWTRLGPPRRAPSLLPAASYPLVELAIYERADFCMPCHQLPPRTAVAGKPLLNTYKEWLEGPYMARGVQCQHCHMPNREHTWLGVHDPDTFRQGARVTASAHRADGAVTVVARVANVGAGHYLPTTPTPAAFLRIELLDARGAAIPGARDELRIGREIEYAAGWRELSDTRIPPGEELVMARAWTAGQVGAAVRARVALEVHPEAYYEKLYAARLAGALPAATRAAYTDALARARATRYVADRREIAIDPSKSGP